MTDETLRKVIAAIPQQSQRQYSTDEQLQMLILAANKLGLYDAADQLSLRLLKPPQPFTRKIETIWSRSV